MLFCYNLQMRAAVMLVVSLMIVVLGNYWFNPYLPICRLPVEYSVGTFDERFGLSREEAIQALKNAEAIWEDSLSDENIFSLEESGGVRVNFIYDERQREAEQAEVARADLATRGEANQVLIELHKQLVAEYDAYSAEYQTRLKNYDQDLASYNAKVEKYNKSGGAPPEAYKQLEEDRNNLENERDYLNSLSNQLNDLADRINSVGEKGNDLVGEYNDRVSEFNDNFAHGHEYTQGDYKAKDINIYTFTSKEELATVLAHELGHSLSIGHVEDKEALMYYLLKDQPSPLVLADDDIEAFINACEGSFIKRLLGSIRAVYNNLVI